APSRRRARGLKSSRLPMGVAMTYSRPLTAVSGLRPGRGWPAGRPRGWRCGRRARWRSREFAAPAAAPLHTADGGFRSSPRSGPASGAPATASRHKPAPAGLACPAHSAEPPAAPGIQRSCWSECRRCRAGVRGFHPAVIPPRPRRPPDRGYRANLRPPATPGWPWPSVADRLGFEVQHAAAAFAHEQAFGVQRHLLQELRTQAHAAAAAGLVVHHCQRLAAGSQHAVKAAQPVLLHLGAQAVALGGDRFPLAAVGLGALGGGGSLALHLALLLLEGRLGRLQRRLQALGLLHDLQLPLFVLADLGLGEGDLIEQRLVLLVGLDVAGVAADLDDLGAQILDLALHLPALALPPLARRLGAVARLLRSAQSGFNRRHPPRQRGDLLVQFPQSLLPLLNFQQDLKVALHA